MLWFLPLAWAQATDGAVPTGLSAQLFRPSLDSPGLLWTDQSLNAPDGTTVGRLLLHYANDPLVYEADGSGERTDLVGGIWQLDVSGATSRGPLRLGATLPVYLRSFGAGGAETGIGDASVEARYTALDRRSSPAGLAAIVRFGLPTSNTELPLGAGFTWEFALVADREIGEQTVVALNVGTRGLPEVELENLSWDDQLFARVGLAHALSESAGVSGEVAGSFTYGAMDQPEGRPAELLVGGWRRTGDLVLRAGVGTALTQGVGAPRYRVMVGLGYEPPVTHDRDLDGLADRDDACPEQPEDLDGYRDEDGCPEATPVRVFLLDRAGDHVVDGSWSSGSSQGGNGELVELDEGAHVFQVGGGRWVADSVEVTVGPGGEQVVELRLQAVPGQIRLDAVHDGQPVAASWTARGASVFQGRSGETVDIDPGDYELLVVADGYKPVRRRVTVAMESQVEVQLELAPSSAKVRGERIEISDRVYFETDRDVIKSESFGLLDDVAELLLAHPELVLVRVEGHTDSDGPEPANLELSQRRAQAVVDYLVGSGVEAERLVAVGYGEGKPLVPNSSPSNKARNRRVEFHVERRQP